MRKAFTVYYDDDAGEVEEIRFEKRFLESDSLLRADILKDALYMLGEEYDKSASQIFAGVGDVIKH